MKKLLTSLTALALVGAMVVPVAAFATDPYEVSTTGDATNTTFTKGVTATYTVVIPAEVSFNTGTTADITVKNAALYEKTLTVKCNVGEGTTSTAFNLTHTDNETTLAVTPAASITFNMDDSNIGNATGNTKEYGFTLAPPTKTGTYSGTAAFNVSLS